MISKGLDFDNIEFVAIPKADSLLYVQDFRAEERAYQLITQVWAEQEEFLVTEKFTSKRIILFIRF